MKKLHLIIILLFYIPCFGQVNSIKIDGQAPIFGNNLFKGQEGGLDFIDPQVGIQIGTRDYPARKSIKFNSGLDTNTLILLQINQFTKVNNIGFKDNHYYYLTFGPSPTFPNSPETLGPVGIAKVSMAGRLIWNRLISPPNISGLEFLGLGSFASITDSSNKIWILSSREYGLINRVFHPVVLCVDTAGSLISSCDINANIPSLGHHIYEIDGNSIGVVGQEWRRDTAVTVMWKVNKSTSTFLSKADYGIISERNSGFRDNIIRVAQGPNHNYFLYGYSRKFNAHPFLNPFFFRAEVRDSLNSLVNSWIMGNEWINYAAFLKSGDLFCQVVTDSGFFLRWYNPSTGSIRQSVFEPVTDTLIGPDITYAYLFPFISDSGNFYCATIFQGVPGGIFTRIYSLQNVGQAWSPWNNPTGLPNSKPSLSLHAYPNPTSGRFRLQGYKEEEGLTLRIFSNSGKEVWRGIPSPEGEIDISQLSPGLYHVEALTSSGKRWSTRVVRE